MSNAPVPPLLPVYKRTPSASSAARALSSTTRRPPLARLHQRHRGHGSATPTRIWSRRSRRRPRSSGTAPTCTASSRRSSWPTRLVRAVVRRPRVLLQLGRRGERGRAQARAPLPRSSAERRSHRIDRLRGRLPRPHARRRLGHRPAEVPRRLRSAARRASIASRSTTGRVEAAIGDRTTARDHRRADPGRGRHPPCRRRLPRRTARSCATSTARC